MADHYPRFRTGKLAPRVDPGVPHFSRYLAVAPLPPAPPAADWLSKVPGWPMLANDRYGDCTEAAVLHAIQQWSAYTGRPFTPTDADTIALYSAVTGFNPGDSNTDRGSVLADVLARWLTDGIAFPGGPDKLAAFTYVDWKNQEHVKQAINLFGNLYLGAQLPIIAENQFATGQPWDVPAGGSLAGEYAPGSAGGHCVLVGAYDADGLTCVTWGRTQRMSWPWLAAYGDEAFALLSRDFVEANDTTPAGLTWGQLQADLQAVREF